MLCHGACVVVIVEPLADLRLAVVWDGGALAAVHVMDGPHYGPVVERWQMHDEHGWPYIACTPDALRELTAFRLEQTPGAIAMVADAVEAGG